jgi:hypothetical protein
MFPDNTIKCIAYGEFEEELVECYTLREMLIVMHVEWLNELLPFYEKVRNLVYDVLKNFGDLPSRMFEAVSCQYLPCLYGELWTLRCTAGGADVDDRLPRKEQPLFPRSRNRNNLLRQRRWQRGYSQLYGPGSAV